MSGAPTIIGGAVQAAPASVRPAPIEVRTFDPGAWPMASVVTFDDAFHITAHLNDIEMFAWLDGAIRNLRQREPAMVMTRVEAAYLLAALGDAVRRPSFQPSAETAGTLLAVAQAFHRAMGRDAA